MTTLCIRFAYSQDGRSLDSVLIPLNLTGFELWLFLEALDVSDKVNSWYLRHDDGLVITSRGDLNLGHCTFTKGPATWRV